MNGQLRLGLFASLGFFVFAATSLAGEGIGIGVLGDSYSDEYQFYPPNRTTSRNWVECLASARKINFGTFTRQNRGEPRNQGFEFNWARSNATSDDLIGAGQHTGLAAQVARGDVRFVVLFVGGNDFIHAIESDDPSRALSGVVPRATENFRTAARTILDASAGVRLAVVTIPDIRQLPEVATVIREKRCSSSLVDEYSAALAQYNSEIRTVALSDPRVALIDFDLMTRIANLASQERTRLVGRTLDRIRGANDLHHLFLADQRHLGTLGQAVLAQMVVHALNAKFGAGIKPLGEREVVGYAVASTAVSDRPAVATRSEEADAQAEGPERRPSLRESID